MYNLGLILKDEGLIHDAIDTLYRSAWDYEYASASYLQLARISSSTGHFAQALHEAGMAVNYNGMNIDAKNLKTTLLRREGRKEEALALAKEVRKFDPLNFYAAREMVKLGAEVDPALKKLLRDEPENYLELAIYYFNNGFVDDCKEILSVSESVKPYPTTEYWLGALQDAAGDSEAAAAFFDKASAQSIDYVFPFRLETAKVLARAAEYRPNDAVTQYYLGNIWYQKQPEKALSHWTKAVELAPDFAMALRCIGWYWRFKDEYVKKDPADYDKAIAWYKKAIAADKDHNAIFLTECDEIMEVANYPLEDRYALFAGKEEVYNRRYDTETRAIRQMILRGEYEKALEPLLSRFYSRREHVDDLHDTYVDACILAGFKAWKDGKDDLALKYMLMGEQYPENQGYSHLEYSARDAQVWYNIGLAYEKTGDPVKAKAYYEKASDVVIKEKDAVYNYEKGLALMKLGRGDGVRKLYKELVRLGKEKKTDYVNNFFESFDRGPYEQDINTAACYMQGVGYQALGRKGKAKRCFREALRYRNDNLWAAYYLGKLN